MDATGDYRRLRQINCSEHGIMMSCNCEDWFGYEAFIHQLQAENAKLYKLCDYDDVDGHSGDKPPQLVEDDEDELIKEARAIRALPRGVKLVHQWGERNPWLLYLNPPNTLTFNPAGAGKTPLEAIRDMKANLSQAHVDAWTVNQINA